MSFSGFVLVTKIFISYRLGYAVPSLLMFGGQGMGVGGQDGSMPRTFPSVLHFLQSEFARFDRDRARCAGPPLPSTRAIGPTHAHTLIRWRSDSAVALPKTRWLLHRPPGCPGPAAAAALLVHCYARAAVLHWPPTRVNALPRGCFAGPCASLRCGCRPGAPAAVGGGGRMKSVSPLAFARACARSRSRAPSSRAWLQPAPQPVVPTRPTSPCTHTVRSPRWPTTGGRRRRRSTRRGSRSWRGRGLATSTSSATFSDGSKCWSMRSRPSGTSCTGGPAGNPSARLAAVRLVAVCRGRGGGRWWRGDRNEERVRHGRSRGAAFAAVAPPGPRSGRLTSPRGRGDTPPPPPPLPPLPQRRTCWSGRRGRRTVPEARASSRRSTEAGAVCRW